MTDTDDTTDDESAQHDDRTLLIEGAPVDADVLDWHDVWKRPVRVEAVTIPAPFTVETMEGTMTADAGHVLLRGVEGELYPCDPVVFAKTYITDSASVPKYSEEDIKAARRRFRNETLDHVPAGVTDTDAREGVRAFLPILREVAHAE